PAGVEPPQTVPARPAPNSEQMPAPMPAVRQAAPAEPAPAVETPAIPAEAAEAPRETSPPAAPATAAPAAAAPVAVPTPSARAVADKPAPGGRPDRASVA